MTIKVGQNLKRSFTQTSVLMMLLGLGVMTTTACTSTSAPNTASVSSNTSRAVQKNVIQIGFQKYGTLDLLQKSVKQTQL